ncbi:Ribose 5-phosphate isomerase [Hathewaya histolytica]|uniref:ribose-5-phosphate isomerase n=1 Tax=Hathewaya histolytica TaxID=1498 RepID=UPI0039E87CA2
MFLENRYEKIIEIICSARGVKKEELLEILDEEECRNLLFLMLKKYNCMDEEKLSKELKINNIKKESREAEEQFFVNKEFRDVYFHIIKEFDKII